MLCLRIHKKDGYWIPLNVFKSFCNVFVFAVFCLSIHESFDDVVKLISDSL